MRESLLIRRAAVLGAGVMGAQIAAHLANCGIRTLLYELAADGDDPDARAREAVEGLHALKPSPLVSADVTDRLRPLNYDTGLAELADCDLVIEAIAEREDLKAALYRRVVPHLNGSAVLVTNTSGLSIDGLANVLPEQLRQRFCGAHFFNPPRYMSLLELVPGTATDPGILDGLETFFTTGLGKGVVRAKDTPNFIGNRIGIFALMAGIHHADRLGLSPDMADALTGTLIGRPRSATFRTADVIGLDTFMHVVEGPVPRLQDDPWVHVLELPGWMHDLIADGRMGAKSGAGIYRKGERGIEVLDQSSGTYGPADAVPEPAVKEALSRKDPLERWSGLRALAHPQAEYLWALHRDLFHYAAYWLEAIAPSARQVDFALRRGFAWREGPFETWQAMGWKRVAGWIRTDVASGASLATAPLPQWVDALDGVHGDKGSWSAAAGDWLALSPLPVYERQAFPPRLRGEPPLDSGRSTFETEAVRLWHRDPEIGILSFRTKQNACSQGVLDGVVEAAERAAREYRALVIWQPAGHFSVGADLRGVLEAGRTGDKDFIERFIRAFQAASSALRYAPLPVVAAARGMALGGGCELLLHCDHAVAHLEAGIGLVEAGVGVMPAGRGCTVIASRCWQGPPGAPPADIARAYFHTLSTARRSASARDAQQLGLLDRRDTVIPHPDEILHVAEVQARALAEGGYRAPIPLPIPALGGELLSSIVAELEQRRDEGQLTAHDVEIGRRIAAALCGGEVAAGTLLPEQRFMDLELQGFQELAQMPATHDRIEHMLRTGRPLRN